MRRFASCSIKLAKYYFEQKEYDKCLKYLRRCEEDSVQVQPRVKSTYVSTLFVLCKTVYLLTRTDLDMLGSIDGTSKAQEVQTIYNIAKNIKTLEEKYKISTWYENVEPFVTMLEKLTRIPYSDIDDD